MNVLPLNRKLSAREMRRQVNSTGDAINAQKDVLLTTVGRVDDLERAMAVVSGILARGVWGRLRWVVRGS